MIFAVPQQAAPVDWHRWFAWRPVRVTREYIIWLEFVERSRPRFFGQWVYRFTSPQLDRVKTPF